MAADALLDAETKAFGVTASGWAIDATTNTVFVRDTAAPSNNKNNVPINGYTFDGLGSAAVAGSNLVNSGTTSNRTVSWPTAPYVRSVPHNMLLQSQTMATATWSPFNSTAADAAGVAPDGTTTAVSFLENGGNSTHELDSTIAAVVGRVYNFSVYAKPLGVGSPRYLQILGAGLSAASELINFDVSAGTVDIPTGRTVFRSATITSVGDGWYRCSCVVIASTTGSFTFALADDGATNVSDTYLGDSTSGLLIWGAQVSQGAYLHPYRVTTTAAWYGVPIGYDYVAGQFGIVSEQAATNLLLQSQNIGTTWTNTNSTESLEVAATTAPDGTNTADKIIEASDTGQVHQINQTSASLTSGVQYTFSAYLKAAERTWARLNMATTRFADNVYCDFNLATGQRGTAGAGATHFGIQSIGDGWYRCWVGATCDSTGTNAMNIIIGEGDTDVTYNGNGASGIYVWGSQVEAAQAVNVNYAPSSYIVTGTATAARAADALGCATSTYPHSDAQGTLVLWARARLANAANADRLFEIHNGGATENHSVQRVTGDNPDSWGYAIADGGVSQVSSSVTKVTPAWTTGFKVASAYKLNDSALVADGGAAVVDTACTMPTVTTFNLAYSAVTSTRIFDSFIYQMTYVPRRMSELEMQLATGLPAPIPAGGGGGERYYDHAHRGSTYWRNYLEEGSRRKLGDKKKKLVEELDDMIDELRETIAESPYLAEDTEAAAQRALRVSIALAQSDMGQVKMMDLRKQIAVLGEAIQDIEDEEIILLAIH
jgi:hypothetical protein